MKQRAIDKGKINRRYSGEDAMHDTWEQVLKSMYYYQPKLFHAE
jgi:hypothetical protein